ncbi:MAG: aspartate aminotransferase family protein [Opitutales bacterium]
MIASTELPSRKHLIGNYGEPMGAIVRGQGVRVWDGAGRELIDFGSGIAVSALGHCHPRWVQAVQAQAATLAHISNLYAHPHPEALAERLCGYAGPGKVLFCNSGAEANEALLKLARLHGRRCEGGNEGRRYKVITAHNSFHGRTFGAMAATPQEKIQGGFRPMLEGFTHGSLNDLDSFAALVDEQTAAIFVEPIQGEGGLTVAEAGFLQGLRRLCDEHGLLLMMDEVQTGIGRTGDFFAYEVSGIRPDAIAMAKGLGGGFPIGAIWVAEPHADLFTAGSHGTTYGGGPLACAAALAVLDEIADGGLLEHVRKVSAPWRERLESLADTFPKVVKEVRGRGFLTGLQLHVAPRPVAEAAVAEGLLVVPAGANVLRLLPPLIATAEDLTEATERLERVLARFPLPGAD